VVEVYVAVSNQQQAGLDSGRIMVQFVFIEGFEKAARVGSHKAKIVHISVTHNCLQRS
jgi:hypothetical protein